MVRAAIYAMILLTLSPGAQAAASLQGDAAALAGRAYRRNRSAILACDRLAERRGEDLDGLRVLFRVEARRGRPAVRVAGAALPDKLRRCYQAVALGWQLPRARRGARISFWHLR